MTSRPERLVLLKRPLPLWLGFVLVTLGYVGFRTFYVYKLVHIALVVTLLLLLIALPLSSRFLNRVVILGWPVAAVMTYFLLTLIWAEEPVPAFLSAVTSFSAGIAAFLVGATWRYHFKPSEISGFFLVLASGYVVLCIINYAMFGDLMALEQGSFRTEIASVVAVTIPVLAARTLIFRSILSACTGLAVSALAIHGQSRTAVVLFLLTLATLGVLHLRARLIPIYVAGFVSLMVGLALLPPQTFDRFTSQTLLGTTDEAVIEDLSKPPDMQVDLDRRLMLFAAKREFMNRMAFGIGYMQLPYAIEKNFGRTISAHGFVPALLSEVGLVGGFVLAIALALSFNALRWSAKSSASSVERIFLSHIAVSLALLVVFGALHPLVEYPLFWLLIGLALMGGKMPSRSDGVVNYPLRAESIK